MRALCKECPGLSRTLSDQCDRCAVRESQSPKMEAETSEEEKKVRIQWVQSVAVCTSKNKIENETHNPLQQASSTPSHHITVPAEATDACQALIQFAALSDSVRCSFHIKQMQPAQQ
jgi:hypothetical protein